VKELTQDQALAILKARADAQDDLVTYSRIIDIPSVPLDATEEVWDIVETPLASHHLLVLHALQGMVDGHLLYDPQSYQAVTRATPAGLYLLPETPRAGSVGGGVGSSSRYDPSPNSTKTNEPQKNALSPPDTNQQLKYPEDPKVPEITGEIPQLCHRQPWDEGILITPDDAGKAKLKRLVEETKYHVCRRVMIMEPPGSAKSTYASVVFPTWQMGKRPDQEIILTGWGDPICRRHGKRARTICKSDIYRGIFSTGLDPNTRAAEDWSLVNGSSYKSSGINSGVAGFRCDGLIWDDLTKNRKEADSATIRNDVYNAYVDDARSRKKPEAWEVGIGTRWHEDEVMGRILPEGYAGESGYMLCRDGNVWLVICLAAQCERTDDPLGREVGEYIWTEWFKGDYWAEKKVNPRSWGSLYQQRPAPESGIFFKRDMFNRYETLPEGDNWFGLDPAVTEEEESANPDTTALQVWRTDEFARLYLVDEWCRAVTMDVWIEVMMEWGKRYKPLMVCSESGVIRRAAEPFIRRAMRKTMTFLSFNWAHRHANKAAMARGAQAMAASGQVFVPYGEIGDRFIDECCSFPAGKSDNRVDAFVNLCLHLEGIWDAAPPKTVEEEKPEIGVMTIKSLMPPRFPKKKSRWQKQRYSMSRQ
jgi:phage terminase large subunit-like protein